MIRRIISPGNSSSFFLFGARSTGKSTYIMDQFLISSKRDIKFLHIDLPTDSQERRYRNNPDLLEQDSLKAKFDWVFIDEVQKIPN